MSFSQEYDFSAPPEVVFNSLVDPDRATRWLPSGVSMRLLEPDRLVLRANGSAMELPLSIDRQAMRISGGPGDGSGQAGSVLRGFQGSVQVGQAPAGGSTLRVEIGGVDAGRVRRPVDDAVQRLRGDVSDNFNAG